MSTDHDHEKAALPRRNFLKVLWYGLGLVALGELLMVCLSFLRPTALKPAAGASGRLIDAGTTDSYAPGTVTVFVAGRFYLVCHESGGFLALSGQCTHLGCAVPWDDEQKKFICPCHASQFDLLGNVISSPAPRALDLFAVTIVNNTIKVDIGQKIKRNRFNKSQLVYPEAVAVLKEGGQK